MNLSNAILVDLDGTVTAPNGGAEDPQPVPGVLVDVVEEVLRRGVVIIPVTGAPECLARKIAVAMGLGSNPTIAPCYGTYTLHPKGEDHNVPAEEIAALAVVQGYIAHACKAMRAHADRRRVRHQVNLFWHNETDFLYAQAIWNGQISSAEIEELHRLVDTPGSHGQQLLRLQWVRGAGDFSLNIIPNSAGKQNAVRWCHQRGYRILAAAGDSGPDADILEAAIYPIATIHEDGHPTHPILRGIVERRGVGHIATRPHGYGLADGLTHLLSNWNFFTSQAAA